MEKDINGLIKAVEALIKRKIKEPKHFLVALTHRSYVNEAGSTDADNERMEFLGDAVLDLVISDELMKRYPQKQEGTLSKYRSSIVNERSLAVAARHMNLGEYVRLGKGEERTQGREKDSILANAFEALVAAIYLSQGLRDVAAFVKHHLKSTIENVRIGSERSDYKTSLQEFTQKHLQTTPAYVLTFEGGPDHDKVFESEVWILDQVYGRGRAKSKKDSEQLCAKVALQMLQKEREAGFVD